MYCQACGIALSRQMKYCNLCGALLVDPTESGEIKPSEKRLDEYLDGLFWITVFGLGLILGGSVLMKKVQLGDGLIIAYLILSTTAFLINFGFSVWGALRIVHSAKAKRPVLDAQVKTKELNPENVSATIQPALSVTEQTTRSFEPIQRKRTAE
jgi:hypothetical protein